MSCYFSVAQLLYLQWVYTWYTIILTTICSIERLDVILVTIYCTKNDGAAAVRRIRTIYSINSTHMQLVIEKTNYYTGYSSYVSSCMYTCTCVHVCINYIYIIAYATLASVATTHIYYMQYTHTYIYVPHVLLMYDT